MRAPKLVGILNVTPDSFSDGGEMLPNDVLAKARQLIADGADVLDVGAESTRPNAVTLTADEEWQRLEAVWSPLVALCRKSNVLLSLDTYHPQTAQKALALGCDWINDVRGFVDEAMLAAMRESDCKLVVMHSLSIPARKGEAVQVEDICAFMRQWGQESTQRLQQAGIAKERIIIDAGLGFGKSAEQSLELLLNTYKWRGDAPLFIGHSRKSFLGLLTDKPVNQRDCLTRLCSAKLAAQGVEYLRVHDVAGHRQMFKR